MLILSPDQVARPEKDDRRGTKVNADPEGEEASETNRERHLIRGVNEAPRMWSPKESRNVMPSRNPGRGERKAEPKRW